MNIFSFFSLAELSSIKLLKDKVTLKREPANGNLPQLSTMQLYLNQLIQSSYPNFQLEPSWIAGVFSDMLCKDLFTKTQLERYNELI